MSATIPWNPRILAEVRASNAPRLLAVVATVQRAIAQTGVKT